MVRLSLFLVLLLMLTGCGPGTIYLKHPVTGDVKKCQGDPWLDFDVYAAAEACAKAHEAAGYKRVGDY